MNDKRRRGSQKNGWEAIIKNWTGMDFASTVRADEDWAGPSHGFGGEKPLGWGGGATPPSPLIAVSFNSLSQKMTSDSDLPLLAFQIDRHSFSKEKLNRERA